jgi:hypothetical protein
MTPKKSQAELLAQVVSSVNLPPEAQQAAQHLANSFWTPEDRALGRELGAKAVRSQAESLRTRWREKIIEHIHDAYDSGHYLSRDALIEGLQSFNFAYGIKGKGGGQVQRSTISRWLTEETEAEIRLEAISRLITRRTKR